MEYQKIISFLDNTASQPSKLRKKNWIEINDIPRRTPIVCLPLSL